MLCIKYWSLKGDDCIDNQPQCPIIFRDYVEYNGQTFLEITEKEFPNILPQTYYVSSNGDIYSKNCKGIKISTITSRGYTNNQFRSTLNDKMTVKVHRVVEKVYDSRDDYTGLEINHKNGNKSDNSIFNLEWTTHTENMRHAYRTGLNQNYGERNFSTNITDAQADEICKKLKDGNYNSYVDLAREYNCNPLVITRIARGKAWRRVSEKYDLSYNRANDRFSDAQIHKMCKIFVDNKNKSFDELYLMVIEELGLIPDHNLRTKISRIYHHFPSYFTRITNQYDY